MIPIKNQRLKDMKKAAGGFTLVELLIAMVVTSILGLAVVSSYIAQNNAAISVRQTAQMQQQLRGAMYIMEQDLRIAGYDADPTTTNLFGVTDVRRYSITDETTAPVLSADGSPSLTIAYDWSPTAPVAPLGTTGDGLLNEPTPTYRLFDENGDGVNELVRDDNAALPTLPRQTLVAEDIEAIGFAYAYDADGDNNLDRDAAGNIIWAVDSDNDNELDTSLDANLDGVIDVNDNTDASDARLNTADGGGLVTPVTVDSIRVVRIWLLARAHNASGRFNSNGKQFLVGDQIVPADPAGFTDNIRRNLLIRTVVCRNTGI